MRIKILISFLLFLIPKVSLSEETVFLNGFEDLPLMKGMNIVEDAGISFDSLSGSIVEVYVEAQDVKVKDVFSFYQNTLPQLGWTFDEKKEDIETFHREGQILTIEYLGDTPPKTFRFEAKPTL